MSFGKQFPSPSSSCYSFDFNALPSNYWDSYRSHRSTSEQPTFLSRSRTNTSLLPIASTTRNSSRDIPGPRGMGHCSSQEAIFPGNMPVDINFFASASPFWEGSSSSSTVPSSPAFPSQFIKKEEPDSPKFIIEPLLPSSIVTKRSISSSPSPTCPSKQAELETQLLLSQALAPPTEVPLRATQACNHMRQMMRSFRLNPFSIITSNGKDSKSDIGSDDPVLTWCGEVAKPLDEPPQMFQWQLPGYNSGLEGEFPTLIVMDEICDTAREGTNSSLEVVSGENLESPVISSSLLLSETASSSGFSTPAERETRQFGHSGSLSETSFFSRNMDMNMDTEQGAGSDDSGYASTPSSVYSSHHIDDGSFRISIDRRLHSDPQYTEFPVSKKRRLDMRTDTVFNAHESQSQSYTSASGSATSQAYGYEADLCPNMPRGASVIGVHSFHKHKGSGSEERSNDSHGSKALPASSHDQYHRRSSSGSMHIPTLLNASPNPSSPFCFNSKYSKPIGLSSIDARTASASFPTASSAHEVANIWEHAAKSEPALLLCEPESESHSRSAPLRTGNAMNMADTYTHYSSRSIPIRQPSLYTPGIGVHSDRTRSGVPTYQYSTTSASAMRSSSSSSSSSGSLVSFPQKQYHVQQSQHPFQSQPQHFAHYQERPSRPLLSPLLDTSHLRLPSSLSVCQNGAGDDIQHQSAFAYEHLGVFVTGNGTYSSNESSAGY